MKLIDKSTQLYRMIFNDLRRDLGDGNFDRLFAIHPTPEELKMALQGVAQMRKFKFFSSSLSNGLFMSKRLINNIHEQVKKLFSQKSKDDDDDNKNELTIEDMPFRRRRSLNF